MTPHYQDGSVTLHHGDCLDVLRGLPDNSVDAVVCDPPYGLANTDPAHVAETITRWVNGERDYLPKGVGFMGAAWDAFVPPVAVWDDCLRALKPGGHALVFAGSRTMDLMTLAMRLAGFEIRDSIAWLYGSGFPKSLDVSKAIDTHGAGQMRRAKLAHFIAARGVDAAWLLAQGVADSKSLTDWTTEGHAPSNRNWEKIRDALGVTPDEEAIFEREVIGERATGIGTGRGAVAYIADSDNRDVTAPATDDARKWAGFGTALKPAHEPIVVARKPLNGTVAGNVLTWGTGALNIDGCRIETSERLSQGSRRPGANFDDDNYEWRGIAGEQHAAGRWPANVVLDESQAAALDEMSGTLTSGKMKPTHTTAGVNGRASAYGADAAGGFTTMETYGDSGGASRFFYVAKAPKRERPVIEHADGTRTAHPTVKPIALMRWLVRLVTPPGGTILEPFAGSGTTIEAALLEGFNVIGIEREAEYLPLIEQRIARCAATEPDDDPDLFDLLDGGAA